mmetsp:Transcript_91300/g.160934  ORF Transcript_91300/g.160934 Transcript_91300/m.160934 type:complete len:288 (-) Transcript_91300:168-1031(-)
MSLSEDEAWALCGRFGQWHNNVAQQIAGFLRMPSMRMAAKSWTSGLEEKQPQLFGLVGGDSLNSSYEGVLACALNPREDPICGMCDEDFTEDYDARDEGFEPPGCWCEDMIVSQVPVFPGCTKLPLTARACNQFMAGADNGPSVDGFFCNHCIDQFFIDWKKFNSDLKTGNDLWRFMSNLAEEHGHIQWEVNSCRAVPIYSERSTSSVVLGEKAPGDQFHACRKGAWAMLLNEPGYMRIHDEQPDFPSGGSSADIEHWLEACDKTTFIRKLLYSDRWPLRRNLPAGA